MKEKKKEKKIEIVKYRGISIRISPLFEILSSTMDDSIGMEIVSFLFSLNDRGTLKNVEYIYIYI